MRGVGLGDTFAKVRQLYGRRLQNEPHAYNGPEGRYLTYWVSPTRGVRFEVDAGGRVSAMHGGDETIRLIEGCS